jgi:alpha-galactosidase
MLSLLAAIVANALSAGAAETVWLSALDVSKTVQGSGRPRVDRSVTGAPLSIAGRHFDRGLGTHAISTLAIELGGGTERFTALVGVDDDAKVDAASVVFRVVGDGRTLWKSGVMKLGQAPQPVDVKLSGVRSLLLVVGDARDGINCDHADWADARFEVTGTPPRTVAAPRQEPAVAIILTPKPPPQPRINGARRFGVRPGHPFLFTISATGRRPIRFAVDNLPAGLVLDPRTGRITGVLPNRGKYTVTVRAKNASGEATRKLTIVCGDTLALTPHMGWNSWYIWGDHVTDKIMREAADAMVRTGMIDHGYMYVNMDDSWTRKPGSTDPELSGPPRDAQGNILPNRRFPDMKALVDYIHGQGLLAGIYTGPVTLTCCRHAGCYRHEEQDARQFAAWGFDFLKYDSCTPNNVPKMGAILQTLDRDIVFNVVAGGDMKANGTWGRKAGVHSWRTGEDLAGAWARIDRDVFGLYGRNQIQSLSGPGGWNDPDYLSLGYLAGGGKTTLTPNEQYSYMSLWCLVTAPLIFSGDMTRLDDFTLGLLSNDEVIEVDQDPLGQAARRVAKRGELEVWAKDMKDGRKIVGLFNLDADAQTKTPVCVGWSDLGITGKQLVRDLWRQKDLGTFDGQFSAPVGPDGVVLVSLKPQPAP